MTPVSLLTAGSAVTLVLAAGMFAPGRAGAAESTDEGSEAETTLEDVTIVGSRIRRDTFNSPSPVTVITREEATAAGFSSTTELLQSSSLTSGTAQINNAYGGFVVDGGPGANTLSLRGLGASRTLVLVNGRRVAPAGTRGAVGSADLNVLPSSLVDRIEILKDGASSIYGSDAIAGVVNVITRKNISGVTLEGQYNRPFLMGGEQARAALVAGTTGDRWSLSGSVEFYTRGELRLRDRDWARCNLDQYWDPETGDSLDDIDPLTGQPKCYPISETGSNGVTINTIGTPSVAGLPALGNPSAGPNFNRWRPNSSIVGDGVLEGFEGVSGPSLNVRDTFEERMLEESMISPADIWTGFVQGSYDLRALGNAEIYSEFLLHNRKSKQTGYRQLSLDYRFGSIMIPENLQFGTPFLPAQDPVGVTGTDPVGVRAFVGWGNDSSSQSLTYYKPTVGIRGDLPIAPGWRYDAYTSYSRSDASYTFQSFLIDKLTYASDVVMGPDGPICNITLTNPGEGCVPYPELSTQTIGGVFSRDFKDYIFRDVTGDTIYDEWITSIAVDGPLMQLPYGFVQGVVGFEHRRVKLDDRPDFNSRTHNLYNLTSAEPTYGKDNVTELFAEVEAPLLADMPAANELTFNASVRYTDYDSFGSDTTWKLGLLYSPIDWVSLRGTVGTSFRAPAVYEQFQGATSGFLSQTLDPCNDYGAAGGIVAINCATQIPDPEFLATAGITVYGEGGSENQLEAETSKNLTVGIVLEPPLGTYGDLSLAVDFFDIRINNEVTQLGGTSILDLCYNDPNFDPDAGYCSYIERTVDEPYRLTVRDTFANIATQVARGFEFTVRYEKDIGTGTLRLSGNATKFRKQADKLFLDEELDDVNGTIGYPKWAGLLDAAYEIGSWRFRYGIDIVGRQSSEQYVKDIYLDQGFPPEVVEGAFGVYDWTTGTYATHFASVRFREGDWEVTAGMRNLFDKEPPMISTGYTNRVGNAPLYSGFDYVGRTGFLNVARKF